MEFTYEAGAALVANMVLRVMLGITAVQARAMTAWAWRMVDGVEAAGDPWDLVVPHDVHPALLKLSPDRWHLLDHGLRIGWRLDSPERLAEDGTRLPARRTVYVERDPEGTAPCACVGCRDGRAPWSAFRAVKKL